MRWIHFVLLAALALCAPLRALAADYTPTPQEIAEIDRLTGDFFHALDSGDLRVAYDMQTPSLQAMMTYDQFAQMTREGNASDGELKSRTRTAVGWYLDPPDAQGPGLYVSVDFADAYANVQQGTEYLIWFRAPGASEFKLMRHEQTLLMASPAATPAAEPEPLPETDHNTIGYPSVADARAALTARKDVTVQNTQDGWLVVVDEKANTIWSFAPPGHPAYPAVVKRYTYEQDGNVMLGMNALCEAKKSPCDALIRQFQELNEQAAKRAQGKGNDQQ